VGIIGRNGSGKSTLLQIIGGVLIPTEGEVQAKGRMATLLELGGGFHPEFTGRENIFLNGSILGITHEEMKKRLDEIAAFAEIGEFIEQPVKVYSTGMFVRLAFAVVANLDADILVVDESLAVGDEKFQKKCFNFLERVRKSGGSILFVSHSMQAVERICDRAFLLEGGRILAQGAPKEVIDAYHFLLYGSENLHLQNLNRSLKQARDEDLRINHPSPQRSAAPDPEGDLFLRGDDGLWPEREISYETALGQTGKILWVRIFDQSGMERYVFQAHEFAEIAFQATFSKNFENILAGMRIRTLEGVKVYGTSNFYWQPVQKVEAGEQYIFRFRQILRLCSNTYYLSVAVAERIGEHDMRYIDKLADTVIFKAIEVPLRGDGLANLASEITVEKV
jgi:ABC-type polysaccharide/polyol phosphate transport system ATPase subunit